MSKRKLAAAMFFVLTWCIPMFAQPPRDGACFYREENFRGRSFCVPVGESVDHLQQGFDNGIYSVQIFGRAEAIVFNYPGFTGVNARIAGSIPNLRTLPTADNPSKNWAGRISSVQVNVRRDVYRQGRPLQWGRTQLPRAGACFYRGPGFQGDYFCMDAGESYNSLPPGFNNAIGSVRVFGGVDVTAFNDPNFTGIRIHLRSDMPDLRRLPTQDNAYKNWGNRISSVQVLPRSWH